MNIIVIMFQKRKMKNYMKLQIYAYTKDKIHIKPYVIISS